MSLFAHLALQFGSHPENLATEALGYILQRSGPARDALREELQARGAQMPGGDMSYSTQSVGDDDARPDLVARTSSGDEPLLIEVKFWAGLTEQQPVAYLKRLAPGATLLVVGPDVRLPILWAELLRRCAEAQLPTADRTSGNIRAADVEGRTLVALSWREMLTAMRRRSDGESHGAVTEDIAQLQGLCDRMDQNQFLPVAPEELSSGIYRRVVEFGVMVDHVAGVLAQRGRVETKRLRSVGGNGYYGRYLALRGVGVFLICDVRKWMQYASTPLWLSVYGPQWSKSNSLAAQAALAPLETRQRGTVFLANDGFPTVALFVPAGVERDVVETRIIEQIERVAELIAPLGTTGAIAEPVPPDPST